MIKKLLVCLCVALFGLFFSETYAHAITSYWKFSRELISPSSQLGEKYGRLTLPMEVLGRSQPSFADLRILDATGNEVPYVRLRSVLQTEKPLNTRLFNIGILPDGTRLVTVDTGTDRMMHSRVNIELQGIDFVATVKVEGSDDQKSWAQLTTGVILDRPYRYTKVNYSQVNYRYLRLTISHKSGNTGEVDAVEVFPAEINTAPQSAFSKEALTFTAKPTLSKNNDAMIWEMQTPYPIDVAALTFDISSDYFERRVEIKVSDDGKQWFTTGRGFIFRYPDGGKSLQVQMPVEKSRYWQVWLYHDNDKPLVVSKVDIHGPLEEIIFPYSEGKLFLLYNNELAKAPHYDLANILSHNFANTESFQEWQLGKPKAVNIPEPNPPEQPWTENNKYLLNLVLILMVGVLGFFLKRAYKKT